MNFREFEGFFKKNPHARYCKKNAKNKYYRASELKKAWSLSCKFYKKNYNPILLRQGNLKLEKNVIIWDLPAIVACKYACNGCYAVKAERLYKNTRIMRAFHFAIVAKALKYKTCYNYLTNYLNIEIKKHELYCKLPVVRIHASGDFISFYKKDDYLQLWEDITKSNKKVNFYSYSKVLTNFEIDEINAKHNNFNIVKSLLKDKYINYGKNDYLQTLKLIMQDEPLHVCTYGVKGAKHETCMGSCTKCLKCSNVIFLQH